MWAVTASRAIAEIGGRVYHRPTANQAADTIVRKLDIIYVSRPIEVGDNWTIIPLVEFCNPSIAITQGRIM